MIGLDVGECETEAFWRSFLRSLVKRGLTAVELVVSDAHAGLKSAIAQVLGCPWQRCSIHFLREALGHARKEQQGMLAALLRPLFNAKRGAQARDLVGDALERLRKPLPKVAALLEEAEEDLLAFYAFPHDHWAKLRSTNPLVTSSSTRPVHDVQHEASSGWDRRRGRGYLLHRLVRRRCGGTRARSAGVGTWLRSGVVDRPR